MKVETRDRIQVYEGIVIAIKGSLENVMFTVRRIAVGGIGMERIFPLVSPWIKKIEVKNWVLYGERNFIICVIR